MTIRRLGIFGTRGHGRDVLTFASACGPFEDIVFIDDEYNGKISCGIPVMDLDEFCASGPAEKAVAIAVADGRVREELATRCDERGVSVAELTAPQAVLATGAVIGEGALLSPFSVISSNVRIGRFFQANTMSAVAHDCTIGDFVTFAPGALCNGCTRIGDYAYIGSGAVLKQGTLERPRRIGSGAVIGMGAVVTRDVPDGATVIGNPAKILKMK